MRVKWFAQNTTQLSYPGLEPRPLAPEMSTLTMRQLYLLMVSISVSKKLIGEWSSSYDKKWNQSAYVYRDDDSFTHHCDSYKAFCLFFNLK